MNLDRLTFLTDEQKTKLNKLFEGQSGEDPDKLQTHYGISVAMLVVTAGMLFAPEQYRELCLACLTGLISGNLASMALPWWLLPATILSKVKLDLVMTRSHWTYAFGDNFRHLVQITCMASVAICLLATGHVIPTCMALICIVMRVEFVHRWRMVLRHRLAEITT